MPTPKGARRPMTSVTRRPLPGRGSESDSRCAQGCGTQRAILNERARRSTRRKSSIEPMEGAPDHEASALNQRGPSDPRPHRQHRAARASEQPARRRARSAPPKHRCGDTGRQRSRCLVRLPQPKGAGGQPATVGDTATPIKKRGHRPSRAAPNKRDQSCHGEKPGAFEGGSGSANCTTRSSEVSVGLTQIKI